MHDVCRYLETYTTTQEVAKRKHHGYKYKIMCLQQNYILTNTIFNPFLLLAHTPVATMLAFGNIAILLVAFTVSSAHGTGYWEFCTNSDFTDCGEGVATNNPGCLQESGRQSIRISEGDGGLYLPILIGYSDSNCATEVGCNSVGSNGYEYNIDFTQNQAFKFALGANSFKFISGSPPQCPNGCLGECGPTKRSRIENSNYVKLSQAPPEKRQDGADFHFCDDTNCSENCGAEIEPNSAGCANGESNRKSVYFKGTGSSVWQLGAYDNGNCNGAPVTVLHATQGCNPLPSQHNSWQTVGVSG